jgi:hypothetical protein
VLCIAIFEHEALKLNFDAESPGHNVEAHDLVGDNTGPLIELENLDKGCLAAMARRIIITLRKLVRFM